MSIRHLSLACRPELAVFISLLLAIESSGQERPKLDGTIRTQLETNARQLDGMELTWTEGRRLLTDLDGLKRLGTLETKSEFETSRQCLIRIDGERFFEQFRDLTLLGGLSDRRDLRSFYGTTYVSGSAYPSDSANPGVITIDTPSRIAAMNLSTGGTSRLFEMQYLLEAGFHPPNRALRMGKKVHSLVTSLIEMGRLVSTRTEQGGMFEVLVEYPDPWVRASKRDEEKAIEAINMLRGESRERQMEIYRESIKLAGVQRTCKFVLDPKRNFAVLSQTHARNGEIMFKTRNTNFEEVRPGFWLPRSARVECASYETQPSYVAKTPVYAIKLSLKSAEIKVFDDKDFSSWHNIPGAIVADYLHENATSEMPISYQIPIQVDELEMIVARQQRKTFWGRFWGRYLWFLVLALIFLAVIGRRYVLPSYVQRMP